MKRNVGLSNNATKWMRSHVLLKKTIINSLTLPFGAHVRAILQMTSGSNEDGNNQRALLNFFLPLMGPSKST